MDEKARIEDAQAKVTEMFESRFGFGRSVPEADIEVFEELKAQNAKDRRRLEQKWRKAMKKVIIAGGRDFDNTLAGFRKINKLIARISDDPEKDVTIIEGGAKGADRVGRLWAKEFGARCQTFKADWDTHGKRAGILRNCEMAEHATHLIAFWDGESRGTKHMIEEARRKGLKVAVVWYYTVTDEHNITKIKMGKRNA